MCSAGVEPSPAVQLFSFSPSSAHRWGISSTLPWEALANFAGAESTPSCLFLGQLVGHEVETFVGTPSEGEMGLAGVPTNVGERILPAEPHPPKKSWGEKLGKLIAIFSKPFYSLAAVPLVCCFLILELCTILLSPSLCPRSAQ